MKKKTTITNAGRKQCSVDSYELELHWKQGDDFKARLQETAGNICRALDTWASCFEANAQTCRELATLFEGKYITVDADTHTIVFSGGAKTLKQAVKEKLLLVVKIPVEEMVEDDHAPDLASRTSEPRTNLVSAESAMSPSHPGWQEFLDRLAGAEGCKFNQTDKADPRSVTWDCDSDETCPRARAILADMGLTRAAVEQSITYFRHHGGFCDCEILFNVGWNE